jgi:AraC family transcriptional regulator
LEAVEEKLCEPLSVEGLAAAVYCSVSALQKLFRYAFHCPVGEYIGKRRLSQASRELLSSEKNVTEIALDYQYGSPEVFTRAFKRLWGITPSEFRKTHRFYELFPRFKTQIENGGIVAMSKRKPVDISELYDELKKLANTHILSIDIKNFDQVNKDYGYATGDLAIAEAFRRIERELSGEMLLFRVGGDEFAVVTGYDSLDDAKTLAREVTKHNGEPVKAGNSEIPLSLWVGISRVPDGALSYHRTLELMANAVDSARQSGDCISAFEE